MSMPQRPAQLPAAACARRMTVRPGMGAFAGGLAMKVPLQQSPAAMQKASQEQVRTYASGRQPASTLPSGGTKTNAASLPLHASPRWKSCAGGSAKADKLSNSRAIKVSITAMLKATNMSSLEHREWRLKTTRSRLGCVNPTDRK